MSLSISCFIPCELPFDLGLVGGTIGVLNCWCERISTLYSSDWSNVLRNVIFIHKTAINKLSYQMLMYCQPHINYLICNYVIL